MKLRLQRSLIPSRQRRLPRLQIKLLDGRPQVEGMGAWYSYWRDPYHLLLTIPWVGFLALLGFTYITINALFALVYLVGGDCVANAQPMSFLDKFFFSVQTLATIGYGFMYPKTLYANSVVTVEVMVGIIGIAVLTGLSFARFSRSTARVLFSRVAVITTYEGLPSLIFRAANQRRNQILEAQMRVYLMRDAITAEGRYIRRICDLNLHRSHSPSFALTWSAIHPIDSSSPLYGLSAEDLIELNVSIAISLSGVDEAIAQTVQARHTYGVSEILWNHRFVDVIYQAPNGDRYIDYNFFHDVVPMEKQGAT